MRKSVCFDELENGVRDMGRGEDKRRRARLAVID